MGNDTSSPLKVSSSFSCGVVPEALGTSTSFISKEKYKVKRMKKESALTKHKKWLLELQSTKEKLELEYASELQLKTATREKVFLSF